MKSTHARQNPIVSKVIKFIYISFLYISEINIIASFQ